MTTTHHPETSTLTPALFADLLDPSKSPFDLCHTHNLALDQLHAVTTGAHFRACVRMLEEIHAERTAAQRPQRERLALDALDRIANQIPATNTHAETVRRAAAALLRHKPTTPSEQPAASQTAEQPEPASDQDARTPDHPRQTTPPARPLPSADTSEAPHAPPGATSRETPNEREHHQTIPRSAA